MYEFTETNAQGTREQESLYLAQGFAFEYIDQIAQRDVYPNESNLARLDSFDEVLGAESTDAEEIITQLHEVGSLGTVTHTGGRYFGFIIGGAIPVL